MVAFPDFPSEERPGHMYTSGGISPLMKNGTKIEGSKMLWPCYIEMDLDIFDFDILFVCGAGKSECKFAWPRGVLPHMKVGGLLSPP